MKFIAFVFDFKEIDVEKRRGKHNENNRFQCNTWRKIVVFLRSQFDLSFRVKKIITSFEYFSLIFFLGQAFFINNKIEFSHINTRVDKFITHPSQNLITDQNIFATYVGKAYKSKMLFNKTCTSNMRSFPVYLVKLTFHIKWKIEDIRIL